MLEVEIIRHTALLREVKDCQDYCDNCLRDLKNARKDLRAAKKARVDFVTGLLLPLPLFDGPAPDPATADELVNPETPEEKRARRPKGKRPAVSTEGLT